MRKKQKEMEVEPVVMNGMAAAPAKSKAPAKPRARKSSANVAVANGAVANGTAIEAANGTAGLDHLAQAVSDATSHEREEVARRAYFRWLKRGCPPGSAEQDWLEAERELQEV